MELLLKILNMSITASWIALAVIFLRLLLKKAPKWISCSLWALVGLRLIIPFSFKSKISIIPSPETLPENIITGPDFNVSFGIPVIDVPINEYLNDHYFEGVTVSMGNGETVMSVLTVIWIIGIILMMIYAFFSYLQLKMKMRESFHLKENIYLNDNAPSPFILGIFNPKIYLPSYINEHDSEYVISHEKAHLKRIDHLWKPLGFIILTVYWFNPILWLAYALLCRDIEYACDEKVIREIGEKHKKDYSSALLNCSVQRKVISACPLAFGENGVKNRIKSILNYKKPAFWIIIFSLVAVIIASACLLTDPYKTIRINDYTWNFKYVQNTETGNVDYCSANLTAIYPDSEKAYINITVKEDFFIIGNSSESGGSAYSIRYKHHASNGKSSLYDLEYSGISGIAVINTTTYSDGSREYTLIINISNYSICFSHYDSDKYDSNEPTHILPKSNYTNGHILFYKNKTPEHEEPEVTRYSLLTPEKLSELTESLSKKKWTNDAFTDRTQFNYDGQMFFDGWLLFSYDQKVVYHDSGYFSDVDEEVLNIFRSAQANSKEYSIGFNGIITDADMMFVFPNSADPSTPTIRLGTTEDNLWQKHFTFTWSAFSSEIATGTYELNDYELVLTTLSTLPKQYYFRRDGNNLIFIEEKSSRIPSYRYEQGGELICPVPDGAVFEPIV